MPKLLSRSKHKEFESNSALQIRDQKERRAENAKNLELQETWHAAKFSQVALFIMPAPIHNSATVPSCCPFLIFVSFGFLPFLPPF